MTESSISKYLKSNSVAQEELLTLRLLYELKKAAAEREYHLKIFHPNIDFEGFDIIVDDNHLIGKYQIKSKLDSTTKKWKIQRNMLFPTRKDAKHMQVGDGLMCSNFEKGVILIDAKESSKDFVLEFYYTDYYIIRGISYGLIKKPDRVTKAAKGITQKLFGENRRPSEKIFIGKHLFVKVKSAMCLLAICGFDNSVNVNPRIRFLYLYEKNRIEKHGAKSNNTIQANIEILTNELSKILDEGNRASSQRSLSKLN
jgi:hypothetical protein